MKIFKANDGKMLVRLEKGEEIMESLKKIAKEHCPVGSFSGIGALSPVEIGYYNMKEYVTKEFNQLNTYEVLSLQGNIAKGEEPFIHAHIQCSGSDYCVFGGHLVKGIVSVTMEIAFIPIGASITRKKDKKTDLQLLESS